MILAIEAQRSLPMPFLTGRRLTQPQAQHTSSIQSSFGRGWAVHYRHGRAMRDDQSAGTFSIPLMRVIARRSKRHCPWAQ